MRDVDAIKQELLGLPIEQRARLAEALIDSLQERTPEELEKLWAEEAQRRIAGYEAGSIESVSADEVHASILKRIS
jgi:putative addiction module component (TIGR02574 family)